MQSRGNPGSGTVMYLMRLGYTNVTWCFKESIGIVFFSCGDKAKVTGQCGARTHDIRVISTTL